MNYAKANELFQWSVTFHVSVNDLMPVLALWKSKKINTKQFLEMIGSLKGPTWWDEDTEQLMYEEMPHLFVYSASDDESQPVIEKVYRSPLKSCKPHSFEEIERASTFEEEGRLNQYGLEISRNSEFRTTPDGYVYTYGANGPSFVIQEQYYPHDFVRERDTLEGTVTIHSRRPMEVYSILVHKEDGRIMLEQLKGRDKGRIIVTNKHGTITTIRNSDSVTRYFYNGDGTLSFFNVEFHNRFGDGPTVRYEYVMTKNSQVLQLVKVMLKDELKTVLMIPQD